MEVPESLKAAVKLMQEKGIEARHSYEAEFFDAYLAELGGHILRLAEIMEEEKWDAIDGYRGD